MRTIGFGSLGPALPRPAPSRRARLARRLGRHRRLVAAVLLAAAAGTAVHALTPQPPPQRSVLAASRDLPAGHVVAAGDVRVLALPPAAVPDGALARGAPVSGRVLGSPVRRGEALTDARLAGPGLLAGAGPGLLAVPVAVDGALPPGLVGPGDAVAVLAGASAQELPGATTDGQVLVRRARVLLVQDAGGAGGLLGGAGPGAGPVAVLALDAAQAARVAGASGDRPVTLAVLP